MHQKPALQVFFIRDGIQFPDMVHSLKPNPKNHIQEGWRIADFFSHHPEALNMVGGGGSAAERAPARPNTARLFATCPLASSPQPNPNPLFQFTFLLDDVGVPLNYRHMEGFGVHTFKLVNAAGVETLVKFHWKPKCGEPQNTSRGCGRDPRRRRQRSSRAAGDVASRRCPHAHTPPRTTPPRCQVPAGGGGRARRRHQPQPRHAGACGESAHRGGS